MWANMFLGGPQIAGDKRTGLTQPASKVIERYPKLLTAPHYKFALKDGFN